MKLSKQNQISEEIELQSINASGKEKQIRSNTNENNNHKKSILVKKFLEVKNKLQEWIKDEIDFIKSERRLMKARKNVRCRIEKADFDIYNPESSTPKLYKMEKLEEEQKNTSVVKEEQSETLVKDSQDENAPIVFLEMSEMGVNGSWKRETNENNPCNEMTHL